MWLWKIFKPTTGTIFDSCRIPICEWIEYCLNIFRYVNLNVDSWNNRNAISTSKYWLEKLFLTLKSSQDNVILNGTVWLNETYYSLMMRERVRDEDGKLLGGLSRNQICTLWLHNGLTTVFIEMLVRGYTTTSFEENLYDVLYQPDLHLLTDQLKRNGILIHFIADEVVIPNSVVSTKTVHKDV